MSFCDQCTTGVTHDGTPVGTYEEIGGIKCYVGTPTVDYPKNKVVLFLTDVFGLELVNNLLLVDDFARNGIKTIAPDLFSGDSLSTDVAEYSAEKRTEFMSTWRPKHGPEQTTPIIDKVITGLKESGVTEFGSTGFCFGARYVFNLAFENITAVSVVSHPSMLQVPADIEKYIAQSKAPLLINSCTTDAAFPLEWQATTDSLFGVPKDAQLPVFSDSVFKPGYKREYFEGCSHGFAVRGDMSDPKVKAGKEGAFKASVEWFIKHL